MQGWKRQVSPLQAPPLTRQLAYAFVGYFLEQVEDLLALCVAITLGALLRGKKTLPNDARRVDCVSGTACVLVRTAKTRKMRVALIDWLCTFARINPVLANVSSTLDTHISCKVCKELLLSSD